MKKILESLYFVQWDRYVYDSEMYTFYGWIERKDNYKDFLVLQLLKNGALPFYYCTSSSRYSLEIAKILGFPSENHVDCERVENFIDIKNSIKL